MEKSQSPGTPQQISDLEAVWRLVKILDFKRSAAFLLPGGGMDWWAGWGETSPRRLERENLGFSE